MRNKLNYEDFLFASFINTNFQKFCMFKRTMENKTIVDLTEFEKTINISSSYSSLVAEISELLFSIIWLREEDNKLSSITLSSLGIIDKYAKCKNANQLLRHLRNSIAHKRCEFYDDGSAVFIDMDIDKGNENFRIDLDQKQFQLLREEFRNLAIREFFPKMIKNEFAKYIHIGNDCTLSDYCFCGNNNLEIVTIPNGLINTIPQWSFCNCISLKYFCIPDSVRFIRKRAFSGCNNITTFSCNYHNLELIDDYAFADCTSMASFDIDAKTMVKRRVFSGWTKNQVINIYGETKEPTHWDEDWKKNCAAQIVFI